MAFEDLTFKFYTDENLTVPFVGTYLLNHKTDLSDNPQDFNLYFGSTNATRVLQANSNPGVDQITLTPTDVVPTWEAATARELGDIIQPATPNGRIYECTVAGTSHASTEPTWATIGIGSTTLDGTAVWTLLGAKHEPTELTLALDETDLDTNTPGAPLDLGAEIEGGVSNAIQVFIRVENAVTNVRNNLGKPEYQIFINPVVETDA